MASAGRKAEGVPAEAVRQALAQILESKEFAQSERMRRFLTFAVERQLAGDRESLKEYTIGLEVFDRPSSYDPRVDSIVRVEARRLRRKLRAYYEEAGGEQTVKITLPEGTYAPVIALASAKVAPVAEKAPAAPRDERAIAVLPFVNLSVDRENELFADGLTEELITALAQAPPLRVVSRTSAFQFKNTAEDVRQIGEKLGVSKVLEGSVRRAGDALRVTAQLVNVQDGMQVWSERFDRRMEDIFALQEEIAGAIAGVLRVKLSQAGTEWRPNHVVPGMAVRHVLEGRHFLQKMTPASLRRSIECFQAALTVDHRFAAAHAGIAVALMQMSVFGDVSPASVAVQARSQIEQAIELDDKLAWPYICRALLRSAIQWQWQVAETDYRQAIEMNPSIPDAHYFYAVALLAPLGRFDEAEEQLREALELDPGALIPNTGLGIVHYLRGDNDAALEQFEHTMSLSPQYYGAHRMMSYALIRQGDCHAAVKLLESALPLAEGDPRMPAALGYAYGRCQHKRQAEESLASLEQLAQTTYVAAYDRAMVHLGLGDLDQAGEFLNAAVREKECWLIYANADPVFDPIREHPSFQKLLSKVFPLEPASA